MSKLENERIGKLENEEIRKMRKLGNEEISKWGASYKKSASGRD